MVRAGQALWQLANSLTTRRLETQNFKGAGIRVMEIFILHDGEQSGPHSYGLVKENLDSGAFSLNDLAWMKGFESWKPLWEILGVPPPSEEAGGRYEAPQKPAVETTVGRLPRLFRITGFCLVFFASAAWIMTMSHKKLSRVSSQNAELNSRTAALLNENSQLTNDNAGLRQQNAALEEMLHTKDEMLRAEEEALKKAIADFSDTNQSHVERNIDIPKEKQPASPLQGKTTAATSSLRLPITGEYIKSKSDDGSLIVLSDGSAWEVSSLSQIDTALWLELTDVTIIDGDDPSYPYKMINKDDNEVADVKPLNP
jgi:cell division protein FtsB